MGIGAGQTVKSILGDKKYRGLVNRVKSTEYFAYFVGLWLGDGSSYHSNRESKGSYYSIKIHSTDLEIINKCQECLDYFGIRYSICKFSKNRINPKYSITLYSKELYDFLNSVDYGSIINDFSVYSLSTSFISGFYDAEGWCHKKQHQIGIANTNKELIDAIKYFLDVLGYKYSYREKPYLSRVNKIPNTSYVVTISQTNDYNRFLYEISSCVSRKRGE